MNLTIKEAAEYSNIGINRLSLMLSDPSCPFALFVGKKKLIKRRAFARLFRTYIQTYILYQNGRKWNRCKGATRDYGT